MAWFLVTRDGCLAVSSGVGEEPEGGGAVARVASVVLGVGAEGVVVTWEMLETVWSRKSF